MSSNAMEIAYKFADNGDDERAMKAAVHAINTIGGITRAIDNGDCFHDDIAIDNGGCFDDDYVEVEKDRRRALRRKKTAHVMKTAAAVTPDKPWHASRDMRDMHNYKRYVHGDRDDIRDRERERYEHRYALAVEYKDDAELLAEYVDAHTAYCVASYTLEDIEQQAYSLAWRFVTGKYSHEQITPEEMLNRFEMMKAEYFRIEKDKTRNDERKGEIEKLFGEKLCMNAVDAAMIAEYKQGW